MILNILRSRVCMSHHPAPLFFPLFTNPYGGFLVGKELACQHRKCRFDLWLGRSLGEGHGNPLQYSCLENPMDRGAWWVTVHGVAKSLTQTEVTWCTHTPRFLKKLKIEWSYDPATLLLGTYLEKIIIWKDTFTAMFTAALFTIANTWKQPKWPPIQEWIKKMWYIHIQWNVTQTWKQNEIVPFASMWMDLEIVIMNEVRERQISCYFAYMWNQKNSTNEPTTEQK